jgi:prevent-host-death family protein
MYHVCGYTLSMPTVSIRELANNASGVISEVTASGRPAVVTKHGQPVAAVVPIDEDALEDFVLANAPEFVEGRRAADEELAAGQTRSLESVVADLDDA